MEAFHRVSGLGQMFAYSGCVRVAEGFISRFQQQEAP